jgi:hypothetical protein
MSHLSSLNCSLFKEKSVTMIIKKLSFLAVSTILLGAAKAHGQTNQGEDFWLAELPNGGLVCFDFFTIAMVNPSASMANVVIDHPATAESTPVQISPGSLKTTQFPC